MDIGPFISELLKEQNDVTIPGIGTFYKKRKPAYFDEAKGLFFPPSQVIAFSSEESDDSGHLASYISKQKNLSPPSARYFLEKYSEGLRKQLLTEGQTEIESLGILRKNELEFSFVPQQDIEDEIPFGLVPLREISKRSLTVPVDQEEVVETQTPVISPPLDQEEPQAKWQSKYQSVVIDNNPSEAAVIAPVQTEELEAEDITPHRRKVWPIVLVIGLLLILGSAAAVYYYYPQLFNLPAVNQHPDAKPKAPAKTETHVTDSSLAKADSIYDQLKTAGQEAGLEVEKAPDTVKISTNSTAVKDTLAKVQTISYDIISASFNRRSEAENYIRAMRKKGIDAQIVEDKKRPKFKVSIGHFTDKEKAETEKRRIHDELTKEAWILKTTN